MNKQLEEPRPVVAAEPFDPSELTVREVEKNSSRARPAAGPVSPVQDEEDEENGVWVKQGGKIIAAGLVLAIGVGSYIGLSGKRGPIHKAPERQVVSIQLPKLPPPPPPPPKLPPPPPPEQKMVEQTPVEADKKPDPAPPKNDDPPALGTNIKGPGGSDGFGLGSSGNGGLGRGGNGKSGSKWGWYAGQVQGRISEALRSHRKTRSASLSLQVRVWPDPSGRITRAQLVGSTGDPSLDRTLQSEVLTGLQLAEAPPAGMPTPIVLRLSARRPN